MKLFVPLLATAAIAVCIGGRGIAWSQTSTESDSQTTTSTAPSVTQKTTTVTVPSDTDTTTTTTEDSDAQPAVVEKHHDSSTTYGSDGNTVTHENSTSYDSNR